MNQTLLLLFLLFSLQLSAQIAGKVTNGSGEPLPYVNIYLEGTYTGTTSNEDGNYELSVTEEGNYTVVFQFLGFTKVIKEISVDSFPYILNITLKEQTTSLDEVVINTSEDPAYRIIRNTIAQRKANLDRISEFKADFYSRGLWRVDSIPEKFMGQDVGDFDGQLDSTRTGIVYLSETISKIAFRQPDDFKETIIASKVSGNDNGFSFNSAMDAEYSFYENTADLNAAIVSPIANNALSYYRYKLDGVFYEGNKLVNKIIVTPRRPKDRVWTGIIYIVEDDWELYGLDLTTNGQAIQIPFVKELVFKQNFSFDPKNKFWVKRSQTIDFGFGFFGFNGDGRFIAVYSNYDFTPQFKERSFTNEVLSFEPEANKKDSLFWKGIRPVPLTDEELNDYIKKDSIQQLRKSKPYLDSLDQKNNRFGALDILFGYTYRNSFKKWDISYQGPLPGVNFNTVQGWNGGVGLTYFKAFDENRTRWLSLFSRIRYGISDDRVRPAGGATFNFNRTNRLQLGVYGGNEVVQFNRSQPISPLINTISSLFFERNYMKVYEVNYANVRWSQELFNGLRMSATTGYEQRKPLFNTTDYVTIPNDKVDYTLNNPRQPINEVLQPDIITHDIIKSSITADISFGQKYYSYPDGKFNIGNGKYPSLRIIFENGAGASIDDYNFSQLRAQLYQRINTGNKGEFIYRLKGGTFFNGDDISFADYQHFNGNQTRVGTSFNYTNVFNLLPYYDLSTNQSYFEGHIEHDFRGWILGKIPGINALNFNLVAGAHMLSIDGNKPYTEFSLGIDNLGWGKFRFLRLDYVRSNYNGVGDGALIFGLKFLNLLD
ncbi:MAG: DUF5686 and carboxypeptidase regulatory-like domain-containing protein [Bacteroidia bacterium]|nr:DUF5686 and carboxypeptidase regulatory-like domain-containing protein [Bacteroidia bacterium]NNF31003.1 carboxypeptidase-like regulatory domain-containing protein [Flavobacteriaceae bacterium]NNJ82423.1 carboxypeptidase-like regulatory domain-containing protein [Flavobacteriaceae bacterium]NNK53071.1 carboxypeptidase-like regulatory domain-containing protein [Flavobacteriaceae bacterium]NNM10105.1 carboxypeptidase-like regulatory domain-containing protein [Flavobacteriaceae bacterium]